jgi:urease accessory protein
MLMVPSPSLRVLPDALRARGGVRLVIGPGPRGAAPARIAESGGYRVRFPRTGDGCEGVLINTGGGMAGGDRMTVDVAVRAGAEATLTTQAAEKIYRSDGADAEVAIGLLLEAGSRLDWLPQEQILFDGARLRRSLAVGLAGDARLTLVESVVFGRIAMGEVLETGFFHDRWRIRREGRLVFAEDMRLDGPLRRVLARKAAACGARGLATVLHLAPDAESRRDETRAALDDASSECGVSAWNGMLVARFLSPRPQAIRADLARFLERLRGRPMPRSWQT